jgi:hypothetical protein
MLAVRTLCVYGSTRDQVISVRAVLSDGSIAEFGELSQQEVETKSRSDTLEPLANLVGVRHS